MGGGTLAGLTFGILGMVMAVCTPFAATRCDDGQGAARWGTRGYMEFVPGKMPLILIIPHGGTREPADMPDRISATQERYDTNTVELGRSISEALVEQTGRSPFLIINHAHRKKLDTNRDLLEAAQDDSLATLLWEEFHAFVEEAKAEVVARFGGGLVVDLHGHRHKRPWVELGYLLSPAQLALSGDSLDDPEVVAASSIGAMVKRSGKTLSALLRGPESLGALLEQQGYEAVPSPSNPHPRGDHYFSGGYNTEQHGSLNGGAIAAVQLEAPWHGARDTEAHRLRFGHAVAAALAAYLETLSLHQGEHD